MKAWVLNGPRSLVLEEAPDPIPGEGEVLVRVCAATVGTEETHRYHGRLAGAYPALLPGGACAGEVAAVGPGVTRVRPGQRVMAGLPQACGACEACALDHPNLCRAHADGTAVYRAYAELTVAPQAAVDPLPDELSCPVAALTGPMTAALRAMRRSPPRGVDLAVIAGVGGLGMLLGLALRRDTNATLLAADGSPGRLALARDLFADETVDLGAGDLAAAVRRVRRPGADVVFECEGQEASLFAALDAARTGGVVNLAGRFTSPLTLDLFGTLHARELTLLGSKGPFPYRWEGAPEAFPYLRDPRAVRILTHYVPFAETPAALQLAGSPEAVMVAVVHETP